MGYLRFVLDLPIWIGILIVIPFMVPPICFYTLNTLNVLYSFVSIAIHIYTIIYAFLNVIWWKVILTAVLPGVAQVYWFIIEWRDKGIRGSLFSMLMLWYLLGIIIIYTTPFILRGLNEK